MFLLLLVALVCCQLSNSASSLALAESDRLQGEKLTGTHVKAITDEEQLLPGAPRFVEQPSAVYYVTPSSPASIECVADQAMYVTVHCNGRALNKKVEVASDHERPERQRFHALVDFNDVRQWLGSYYCNCEAWGKIPALKNELRKVISSSAYVRLAYFEADRFQFDPVPKSVPLDANNVILSCTPPKGSPKPKVKWLKNGQPLDVRSLGDRATIDHQAQLIIRPLRLEDSGNYSCLAEIPGQTVASRSAQLTIYVNGGWSSWSMWIGCDPSCDETAPECRAECVGQQRTRERRCDSPAPSFNGFPCRGAASETAPCNAKCAVHGQWGQWSQWTQCSSDCLTSRQRKCDSPPPSGPGGRPCPGMASSAATGQEWRNCSEGRLCKRDNAALLMLRNDARSRAGGSDSGAESGGAFASIAVYIGLVAAAAVLLVIALVVFFLVRRKSAPFAGNRRGLRYNVHMNGNSSASSSAGKEAQITHELLLPAGHTGSTIKNAGVMLEMSASGAPASGMPPSLGSYQHLQQQQQQQQHALRVQLPLPQMSYLQQQQQQQQQCCQRPASSLGVYSNGQLDCSGSSNLSPSGCGIGNGLEGGGDDCSSLNRPCSALYHEPASLLGGHVTAACVPAGLSADQVAWGTVGPAGGRLCLPESGVSLTVPAGAVTSPHGEDLFLAVCRDERDHPSLDGRRTLLSSTVACGPASVLLAKPVILSLPHSASLRHGFWNVVVMRRRCDSPQPTDPPSTGEFDSSTTAAASTWLEFLRVGSESAAPAPAYCQLDAADSLCHLVTDSLGRYCLVGQSLDGGSAVKQLRVAAFVSANPAGSELAVRVHALPDTGDALAAVLAAERSAGWRLIDEPRQLAFRDCGAATGQPQPQSAALCCGVEDLSLGWRCRTRRVEVPFGHVWSSGPGGLHCSLSLEQVDPTRLAVSCCLAVYQAGSYSARLVLRLACSRGEQAGPVLSSHSVSPISSACLPVVDPLQPVFRLQPKLRAALSRLLDAPSARGNDWRQLARLLGLDRQVAYFAARPSPSECLLDLWDARSRQSGALADLAEALKAMGRRDAASLVEQGWL